MKFSQSGLNHVSRFSLRFNFSEWLHRSEDLSGQPCRKLREFRRYLSPGPMILSSIICIPVFYPDPNYLQTFYRDLHAFWIRTCRSIEFKFAFRYGLLFLERDQPPPFSRSYFSGFFQGKRSLPSLLPFYTLWGRRWDNRGHRLSSSQFIEACFNVKTQPCWLASFKLYVPPFKSGGRFYVWPEAARALVDWIRHGIGR